MKIWIVMALMVSFAVNANDDTEAYRKQVMKQVNGYRASFDLPPLKSDNVALGFAVAHSDYMASVKGLNHHGFNIRVDILGKRIGAKSISENVAVSTGSPSFVVENWTSREKHRAVILGDFTHTAIGVWKGEDGKYYYTQIFVKR